MKQKGRATNRRPLPNPSKGGRANKAPALTEDDYDEIDRFHQARDDGNISFQPEEEEEDGGKDVGVFQLDVSDDSSDDDDDDEEEEEGDDDDDDESGSGNENSDDEGAARRGKQAEPSGLLSDEEEDDSADEQSRDKLLKWGKNKQQYYNADATDLEIGQDFADAEEEERAAREAEQARFSKLDEQDFGLGTSLTDGVKPKKGKGKDKGSAHESHSALIQMGAVETQKIARNVNKLSKTGQLQVLLTESPELLVLLEEFNSKLEELKDKVEPVFPIISKGAGSVSDDTVAYLEVKQQLLLSYCINVTFYMLLKAEGKSVQDHPVIEQLMELRTALEKMKPLDAKLKFQIERLLKVQDEKRADGKDPLSFRPNPDALVGKDAEADDDEDGGDAEGVSKGVYRAPRLAAVPYDPENEDRVTREEEKRKRKLEKLRRSDIHQTLLEEFSERPDEVVERGFSDKEKRLAEEMAERTRFEEERFIRLTTTKKERKQRKQLERESTRLETIADIGNFQEYEDAGLDVLGSGKTTHGFAGDTNGAATKKTSSTSALQKAVNALTQKESSRRRKRDEVIGDADVTIREPSSAMLSYGEGDGESEAPMSKRALKRAKVVQKQQQLAHEGFDFDDRGAGDMDMGEDDGFYEQTAEQQAKKKEQKVAKYTAEPNYGGTEDIIDDEEKRGINYEIEKNRGLTAYKNKINRNPRVKKREAYRKAVIRRKGQVRDVRPSEFVGYGGEATGINAKVVRTRMKSKK